MAWHLGIEDVSGWIFERVNPGPNEVMWGGTTRYPVTKALGALERRMFGVAGAVAESCWRRERFYPELWRLRLVPMSPSDWSGTDCTAGEPDELCYDAIRRVHELFNRDTGELWGDLCRTARALIAQERDSRAKTVQLMTARLAGLPPGQPHYFREALARLQSPPEPPEHYRTEWD